VNIIQNTRSCLSL